MNSINRISAVNDFDVVHGVRGHRLLDAENCDLSNDYCQGTDLDFSGMVDADDLEILLENWLAEGELEN